MEERKKEHKKEYRLAETEARFAELIWQREPILSPELVKLCEKEFTWKKSTTYTVLKKLCDRGIFQNENCRKNRHYHFAVCSSINCLISSACFFGGSIPRFLTAFMGGKKLTKKQADEIKQLIEEHTAK